jgi:Arc/MetJ-type ribon-helix-helix transcriptional regulator
MAELLLKYKTRHITVSFPPYLLDLMTEHCYLTGLSKQDLIRLAVRKLLSEKYDKDIEQVAIERMKKPNM